MLAALLRLFKLCLLPDGITMLVALLRSFILYLLFNRRINMLASFIYIVLNAVA